MRLTVHTSSWYYMRERVESDVLISEYIERRMTNPEQNGH